MDKNAFLSYLVQQKKMTRVQLNECIRASAIEKKTLLQILLQKGYFTPETFKLFLDDFKQQGQVPIPEREANSSEKADIFQELERFAQETPKKEISTTLSIEAKTSADIPLVTQQEDIFVRAETTAFDPFLSNKPKKTKKNGDKHRFIERYEVLETLGEGGMGVVQKVKDHFLHREVALKRIKFDAKKVKELSLYQKNLLWRLRKEAEITAILEHPNIVPLYDMHKDNTDGLYFTMRKVEGETFRSLLKKMAEGELSFQEDKNLSIFFKICDAVSYAHSKGIIHRDLKPDNVMVGPFGEVYVMDWGIAKGGEQNDFLEAFKSEDNLTKEQFLQTLGGIGTPGYMAPEQAEEASNVTIQADIYALGKILRECYVLLSPLEELKQEATQYQAATHSKSLKKKRQLDLPVVPEDIQAIVQKATQTHWNERYHSVPKLVADIENYLQHLRVSVREYTLFELVMKYGRRHKKTLLALFSIVCLCLFWFIQVNRERNRALKAEMDATTARDQAQKNEEEALKQQKAATENAVRSYIQEAQHLWENGELQKACLLYAHAILEGERGNISPDLLQTARLWLAYRFPEYPACEKKFAITEGQENHISALVLHPNEKTFFTGSKNGTLRSWDIETGKATLWPKEHHGTINKLAFKPKSQGNLFASVSQDGTIRIWEVFSQKSFRVELANSKPIYAVSFTPDGALMIVGGFDGNIYLFETEHYRLVETLKGHRAPVTNLSVYDNILASAGVDRTVYLWNLSTKKLQKILREQHSEVIRSLQFSPNGKILASGSQDGSICLWDIPTGNFLFVLRSQNHWVFDVAFSPDSATLASGNWNGTVTLWDVNSQTIRAVLQGSRDAVSCVAFTTTGKLISASLDRSIRFWKTDFERIIHSEKIAKGFSSVAFAPTKSILASGNTLGEVWFWFWDISQKKFRIEQVKAYQGVVYAVAFHPDGNQILSTAGDGTIALWELHPTRLRTYFKGHQDAVTGAVFSPKGNLVASCSLDGTVRLWETDTGIQKNIFHANGWVFSALFSADGKKVITAVKNIFYFWDVQNGTLIRSFPFDSNQEIAGDSFSLALSPNQKYIAIGRYNGTIWLYDLETEKTHVLRGHFSSVHSVVFSSDGKTLASAGGDGTIRLWEIPLGQTKSIFKRHTKTIFSLAFSHEDQYLASASDDGLVHIWKTFYEADFLSLPADEILRKVEKATLFQLQEFTFLTPLPSEEQ